MTNRPILEVFVHEDEAGSEKKLAQLCEARAGEHARNLISLLLRPGDLRKKAGTGPKRALCRLDEIPDGGSNGFFTETNDGRLLYMAIRLGDEVFVYENACPHTGMPLDFQPGRFLDPEGAMIQCSTHGAKFRIEDGFCVSGPCEGDSLKAVASEVRDGRVFVVG